MFHLVSHFSSSTGPDLCLLFPRSWRRAFERHNDLFHRIEFPDVRFTAVQSSSILIFSSRSQPQRFYHVHLDYQYLFRLSQRCCNLRTSSHHREYSWTKLKSRCQESIKIDSPIHISRAFGNLWPIPHRLSCQVFHMPIVLIVVVKARKQAYLSREREVSVC